MQKRCEKEPPSGRAEETGGGALPWRVQHVLREVNICVSPEPYGLGVVARCIGNGHCDHYSRSGGGGMLGGVIYKDSKVGPKSFELSFFRPSGAVQRVGSWQNQTSTRTRGCIQRDCSFDEQGDCADFCTDGTT